MPPPFFTCWSQDCSGSIPTPQDMLHRMKTAGLGAPLITRKDLDAMFGMFDVSCYWGISWSRLGGSVPCSLMMGALPNPNYCCLPRR